MGALLDCLRTAQEHGLPWIPPCPKAIKDLDFWIDVAHHWNGRGIQVSDSDERLTTDAGPDRYTSTIRTLANVNPNY
jgi:hypothetical protein